MAAGDEDGQDFLDDGLLAYDGASELVAEARRQTLRLFEREHRGEIVSAWTTDGRAAADAIKVARAVHFALRDARTMVPNNPTGARRGPLLRRALGGVHVRSNFRYGT